MITLTLQALIGRSRNFEGEGVKALYHSRRIYAYFTANAHINEL